MARQSLARFLRKQLKFPGTTIPSGPKFWLCRIDDSITWEQFVARVQSIEARLKARGIITAVVVTEDRVDMKFVKVTSRPNAAEGYERAWTQAFMRYSIETGVYYVDAAWDIVT